MSSKNNQNEFVQIELDFLVQDPKQTPTDTVQAIKFAPTIPQVFAVGSWDDTIRIYQIVKDIGKRGVEQKLNINVGGPVLDFCWSSKSEYLFVLTGHPTTNFVCVSMQGGGAVSHIGHHPYGLSVLSFNTNGMEIITTLGGDKKVNFWLPVQNKWEIKFQLVLKKIPTCMDIDISSGLLVIGIECDMAFYKLERLQSGNTTVDYIDLMLKSTTTCIKIRDKAQEDEDRQFKQDNRIITVSGVDGRIYVGEYNISTFKKVEDRILFKAHMRKEQLFSVNGLGFSNYSFYSMYTFSTDGTIIFWDIIKKNKLTAYLVAEDTPITAGGLSPTHDYFVYAVGYDWSLGVWGTMKYKTKPRIIIHEMKTKDHKRS